MAATNNKIDYGASAAATITLASLATSATWVAGRASAVIANTTDKFFDYWVGGKITVGTTPTAGTRIEVWVIPRKNDTPTYHDVFGGNDADETVTAREMLQAYGKLLATIWVPATTSDRGYEFSASVRAACEGVCPAAFQLFVTHNTGVNLNSTGGNHVIDVKGVYSTSGG